MLPFTSRKHAWSSGLLLLALCFLSTSASAQQLEFVPTPADGRFACDDVLVVDLVMDAGITNLRAYSLVIEFDPTIIEPIQVEPGPLLLGAPCPPFFAWINQFSVSNTIEVDAGSLGCSTAGPGSILRMVFRGVAAGTSPLHLVSGDLRNGLNQPVAFTLPDAFVGWDCNLQIFPPTAEFLCPNLLTIYVQLEDTATDVRGMSFVFDYDPAVIRPVAVSQGSLALGAACSGFLQWIDPFPNDGSLEVDLGFLGCSIDGPGPVLELTFQGVVDGITQVTCSQSILRDSLNQTIPSACAPATILYSCPVNTEASRWGHLKARYR